MADILHRIEIETPKARVHQALTSVEGLAGWWTREVTRSGDVIAFRFSGYAKGAADMRVDESGAGRVAWTCVGGPEEWIGTKIAFDLADENGRSVVRFGHRGWKEPGDFFAHCSCKWASFLISLKDYVERGRGAPSPDDLRI